MMTCNSFKAHPENANARGKSPEKGGHSTEMERDSEKTSTQKKQRAGALETLLTLSLSITFLQLTLTLGATTAQGMRVIMVLDIIL